MVIEILNGGEILVNCKFKFNKICTVRNLGIQIQSKSQFDFVPWDTEIFEFTHMVAPTQDRYYLDTDVHPKCEELRSNQLPFLVSSVRHWTHLESILPQ